FQKSAPGAAPGGFGPRDVPPSPRRSTRRGGWRGADARTVSASRERLARLRRRPRESQRAEYRGPGFADTPQWAAPSPRLPGARAPGTVRTEDCRTESSCGRESLGRGIVHGGQMDVTDLLLGDPLDRT